MVHAAQSVLAESRCIRGCPQVYCWSLGQNFLRSYGLRSRTRPAPKSRASRSFDCKIEIRSCSSRGHLGSFLILPAILFKRLSFDTYRRSSASRSAGVRAWRFMRDSDGVATSMNAMQVCKTPINQTDLTRTMQVRSVELSPFYAPRNTPQVPVPPRLAQICRYPDPQSGRST